MNAKVVALAAAAVALILIGQNIDISRVGTVLAGASAPGAEVIDSSVEEFTAPDQGMPAGLVVLATGASLRV